MDLTAKQRTALQLICDTFAPGDGDRLPAASALGAVEVMAELAGRNPRAAERKQLTTLLGLWNSPVMGALAGQRWRRFSAMDQQQREQVLLSYADSRLTAAGLDIVLLEAGEYYDDADFDGAVLSGIKRLYAAAPSATAEGQVNLVAGSCLGGGTVVNYTTSFRTPDDVRAEWASHGVPQFEGEEYSATSRAATWASSADAAPSAAGWALSSQ